MALWGVSGSDVTNSVWNTAVGFGVLAGCAGAALVVKKIAARAFAAREKTTMYADKQEQKHDLYSSSLGLVVGLAAAVAAYKFIPVSRFALISDISTSKMFKLGAVQAAVGFVIDYLVGRGYHIGAVVGLGGAAATRFGYPILGALGAIGAGVGSGFISTPPKESYKKQVRDVSGHSG